MIDTCEQYVLEELRQAKENLKTVKEELKIIREELGKRNQMLYENVYALKKHLHLDNKNNLVLKVSEKDDAYKVLIQYITKEVNEDGK